MKQYEDLFHNASKEQIVKDSSSVAYGNVDNLRMQGINLLWGTENVDILSSLVSAMKRKYEELVEKSSKENVQPYSIEELFADIDESERQFANGDFITGNELDDKVNELIASWR